MSTPQKLIRCAIYTRKSTSEGLDQDFTSLDAQREAAESYIKSLKNEGWVTLPERYDDGGFTGANTDRPALQKLLSDIRQGYVDCVVVYKVDRLSRSLLDFAKLLELFEAQKVTFVSVTQHFNTQNSMGRLTLNILLSFAQFEREMISERTRDKMAAARKKGKWVGGTPPLGYDLDREIKRLVINEKEAPLVRRIFELYLEKGSLLAVAKCLNDEGARTKQVTIRKNGRVRGGEAFKNTHVQAIVRNVIYTGQVAYSGTRYPGEHEAIISVELYEKAQKALAENRLRPLSGKNVKQAGLLTHLLRCKACDAAMFHTYTHYHRNKRHIYRYYVCTSAQKKGYATCPAPSVNAQAMDDAALRCLRTLAKDPAHPREHTKALRTLLDEEVWDALFIQEKRRLIRSILKEVAYDGVAKKLSLVLNKQGAGTSESHYEFPVDLRPVRPVASSKRKQEARREPPLLQTLLLAHQFNELLLSGKAKSIAQLARWLHMTPARVSQIMGLVLLAPSIQEWFLLNGVGSIEKLYERNVRSIASELNWQEQTRLWHRHHTPSQKTESL